jgi:hypothetical protein
MFSFMCDVCLSAHGASLDGPWPTLATRPRLARDWVFLHKQGKYATV